MKISEYIVREASNEEIPTINSLLERSFHHEDPFMYCLLAKHKNTLTQEDIRKLYEEIRKCITSLILKFSCVVVVHKETGKIVGVNVLSVSENPNLLPSEHREINVYKTKSPPKSQLVREYFYYVNDIIDRSDLYSKFSEARRFVELYAVAVDEEHRKRGLSTLLIKEAMNLVFKRNTADVIFGLFTSPFSKRAAEKVGLKDVMDLDLLEYRDTDGSSIFEKSKGCNNIVSVMAVETRTINCFFT